MNQQNDTNKSSKDPLLILKQKKQQIEYEKQAKTQGEFFIINNVNNFQIPEKILEFYPKIEKSNSPKKKRNLLLNQDKVKFEDILEKNASNILMKNIKNIHLLGKLKKQRRFNVYLMTIQQVQLQQILMQNLFIQFIIYSQSQELYQQYHLDYFIFPKSLIESVDKNIDKRTNTGTIAITLKDLRFYSFKFINKDLDFIETSYCFISQFCLIDQTQQDLLIYRQYIWHKPVLNNPYNIKKEFQRQNMAQDSHQLYFNDNISTYPKMIYLPASFNIQQIEKVINFRSLGRIPILTFHYKGKSVYRCSQSMPGPSGNRCKDDERLLECMSPLHIYDARSWLVAKANMMNGKGTENMSYYKGQLFFLDIENIHKVRDAYKNLKKLISNKEKNWFSGLENCLWFQNIQTILVGAVKIMKSMLVEEQNILVHCSDGWDRTSQLCSLVQIMLDPYFRSIEGFSVLVEKDWVSHGHQFQLRSGHFKNTEETQRSQIFILFLDCVYQIMQQFPLSFEYNSKYLQFLAFHVYSCLFNTFLGDNERQANQYRSFGVSIWSYINNNIEEFKNIYYSDEIAQIEILEPKTGFQFFKIWKEHFFQHSSDHFDNYADIFQDGEVNFTEQFFYRRDHKEEMYKRDKIQLQCYKQIIRNYENEINELKIQMQQYQQNFDLNQAYQQNQDEIIYDQISQDKKEKALKQRQSEDFSDIQINESYTDLFQNPKKIIN